MVEPPNFGPRPEHRDSVRVPGESSYGRRRRWQRDEARRREQLRPLRLYVNRLLATTGIPHGHTYVSGRISGLHHATEGWQTQSDISVLRPGILVEIYEQSTTSLYSAPPKGWRKKIIAKLEDSGLVVESTGSDLKVYPKEWREDEVSKGE
jgi:hypothetical protein